MPTIQVQMGRKFRARRALLGMTQKTLAEVTHIKQEHVSRLERGDFHAINPAQLALLAKHLDTSADYLLGLTQESNGHA